nr:hypothetical protein MACL_00003060 [Theileria orientalis]
MICVQVDKTDQLILLGCDNKKYLIYDHDFNVLYDRLVVVSYSVTHLPFPCLLKLQEIRSISCMDIVDNKFLVSISIENTIRIWCLSTFSELLCINLPTDVLRNEANDGSDDSLRYNVSCEYSKNLIVVPYCNHLLVTQFNFDKLELRDYFVFKLPFVAQSSLFIDGHLYLIDEFSSLYSVEFDAELGVKDDKDSRKGTIQQSGRVPSSQFSTNIAVELPPLTASKALEPRLLHDDQNRNRGVKINITKHVNV